MKIGFFVATFISVFVLHVISIKFLFIPVCGPAFTLTKYFTDGDVFIGFSYAVSGVYTVWSLRCFLASHASLAAVGAAGGFFFTAMLTGVVCFFAGCCGSPMLLVYAGILGVNTLSIPKWTIALLTLLVVAIFWRVQTHSVRCGCRKNDCTK